MAPMTIWATPGNPKQQLVVVENPGLPQNKRHVPVIPRPAKKFDILLLRAELLKYSEGQNSASAQGDLFARSAVPKAATRGKEAYGRTGF